MELNSGILWKMKGNFLFASFFISTMLSAYSQTPPLEIREYAKSAPLFISRSPQKLAAYLTGSDTAEKVSAITMADNSRSIPLLEKMQFKFVGKFSFPGSTEELLLYST